MLQIISCKRKKGTFEGKTYDNVNLTCADYGSKNEQLLFGPDIEVLKMKYEEFGLALGRNIGALNDPDVKTVEDIEGLLIAPVYNKFGNVIDFTLSNSK